MSLTGTTLGEAEHLSDGSELAIFHEISEAQDPQSTVDTLVLNRRKIIIEVIEGFFEEFEYLAVNALGVESYDQLVEKVDRALERNGVSASQADIESRIRGLLFHYTRTHGREN